MNNSDSSTGAQSPTAQKERIPEKVARLADPERGVDRMYEARARALGVDPDAAEWR